MQTGLGSEGAPDATQRLFSYYHFDIVAHACVHDIRTSMGTLEASPGLPGPPDAWNRFVHESLVDFLVKGYCLYKFRRSEAQENPTRIAEVVHRERDLGVKTDARGKFRLQKAENGIMVKVYVAPDPRSLAPRTSYAALERLIQQTWLAENAMLQAEVERASPMLYLKHASAGTNFLRGQFHEDYLDQAVEGMASAYTQDDQLSLERLELQRMSIAIMNRGRGAGTSQDTKQEAQAKEMSDVYTGIPILTPANAGGRHETRFLPLPHGYDAVGQPYVPPSTGQQLLSLRHELDTKTCLAFHVPAGRILEGARNAGVRVRVAEEASLESFESTIVTWQTFYASWLETICSLLNDQPTKISFVNGAFPRYPS